MKLTVIAIVSTLAEAGNTSTSKHWTNNVRRRLSFEKVAGYEPGSQVTDHCAIDRDQLAMEDQLALATDESYEAARRIFNEGGNSKSYATITLSTPLAVDVAEDDEIIGRSEDGTQVAGKAYDPYTTGTSTINVFYETTDTQAEYVNCQVGALVETNLEGCFAASGTVTIGGTDYEYTYDPATDNNNDRTIAKFSTSADTLMLAGCPGCPYKDFKYFYDYYGTHDYAFQWVESAFDAKSTSFANGNADFSVYGFDGREQAIKKGSAYMSVFMYVIREFEDALDDCQKGIISDNYNSVHAWDEGVCFYTGSIEGQDGVSSDGKLIHQLMDKRCADFKTCGSDGTSTDGRAKLNYDLGGLFTLGNFQIKSGDCEAARSTLEQITTKMYIPFLQGTMSYAYELEMLQGGEKEAAEAATFAAAVLPRIHAADPTAASTIYDSVKVGATATDYKAVKSAIESVYPSLGITCEEVGGFWNPATNAYYEGMEPCKTQTESSAAAATSGSSNKTTAIVISSIFGALFVLSAAMILYMRSREKQGQPVFRVSATGDVKDVN